MKTRTIFATLAAAVILALAGCSTPASRIEKNPAVFATYTPAQQDLIKQGKVAVGFDQEAVRLALGDPDHERNRTTKDGNATIWSYVTYDTLDGFPLYRGYYHRYYGRGGYRRGGYGGFGYSGYGYGGWGGGGFYPWYMDYDRRVEREHLRVVFDKTGKVAMIEQETE